MQNILMLFKPAEHDMPQWPEATGIGATRRDILHASARQNVHPLQA
jgi:hypothetical protein